MQVCFINKTNRFFPDVVALGKKNSATLGFMPDGGFEDHANKHCIIIAYNESDLLGYLMYREVRRFSRVSIVHLCIDERYRGHHVTSNLLDALKNRYKTKDNYKGISLSCRDDYKGASQMWQNYGFTIRQSIRSRSIEEHHLNLWWYDFNKPDLFSGIEDSKVKASLDMNIIIKLRDSNMNHESWEDPRPLMADWLVDEADYYYAPECLNEILRDGHYGRTCETRKFIKNNFIEAKCDAEDVKKVAKELEEIIPGHSDNDKSDRKQIATSIVAGMSYFITLDNGIINKREEIESKYGIQIFTPTEFILKIDHLLHDKEYRPTLLKGVAFSKVANICEADLNKCIDEFSVDLTGKDKSDFRNAVCEAVSDKSKRIKIIIKDNTNLAFYSYGYSDNELIIPFIKIKNDISSQTLFMQLISDLITKASSKNINKITYKEQIKENYKEGVLRKFGFIKNNLAIWKKYVINNVVDKVSLMNLLR